jgi:hypothetical protein
VRGGAIPVLAWGTLLLILFAIDWVWEGRLIQVASTTFAILAVYGTALGLWLARREALRRGPPPARRDAEAVPSASVWAVLVGLAISAILFGLVWAAFLVYFGLGVLLVALVAIVREVRAQRRSLARAPGEAGR